MAIESAEILYFCFGCLFLTAACLEITYSSSEKVDGDSFKTGSEVNFTCTHQSYQGIQIWTFDTMKLLDCGFVECDNFTSDDRFSFSNDINNGIFIFTINHVELSDDGKIIECDDGSVNKTFEINVKGVITSSPSSTPNNDGCINACDCCDCDIKELIIVIAVAWASAIALTFVGSCILKFFLNTADLHECIFNLGSLPWIFLSVVVLLYKGDKKRGLIPLVISFVLDAVFIGIDRYYVCSCKNVCDIELLDHLWASFIYLMVCAVLSVLKYIIIEKCCGSDSTVSDSNPDLNHSDVPDSQEQPKTRPLPRPLPPRISSASTRHEKEHEHSLNHVKLMHRSPLSPISSKEDS